MCVCMFDVCCKHMPLVQTFVGSCAQDAIFIRWCGSRVGVAVVNTMWYFCIGVYFCAYFRVVI